MERYRKIVIVNIIIFALFSYPFLPSLEGKVRSSSITIKDIKITDELERIEIEIHSNKRFKEYKAFTLKSPARIVLDIFGARYNGLLLENISSFDIPPVYRIRLGHHIDKVRLVLDISSEEIPHYNIKKNGTNLFIEIDKGLKSRNSLSPTRDYSPMSESPVIAIKGKTLDLKHSEDSNDYEVEIFSKKSQDENEIENKEIAMLPSVARNDFEGEIATLPSVARNDMEKIETKEEKEPKKTEAPLMDQVAKDKDSFPEKDLTKEQALPSKDKELIWVKGDFKLDLKGYYKNIAIGSKTVDKDKYFLDINRFRLDLTGTWKDSLVLKLVYDQEALLGDYIRSEEFRRIKSYDRHDLINLDWEITDNDDFYWRHYLYRAYLRFQSEKFNLSLGRQRIAWGSGKFWNPTDIFNPFNPIQIERDERIGVDSIDMEFFLKPMTSFNLVYAPKDSSSRSKGALKFKNTYKDLDFSILGGKSGRDRIIGGDFSTTIMDGGFRGEILTHFVPNRKNYYQFILNYDYTFRNSFYVLVEYFHNSGPLRENEFLQLVDRGTHTLTRNLFGINLGYDITPLLRADLYIIYGVKNEGLFLHPKLRYSILQNLELVGGMQWFNRKKGSEFEFENNLYFAYIQYYF